MTVSRHLSVVLLVASCVGLPSIHAEDLPDSRPLFPAVGEVGEPYKRWRIPILVVAPDSSLLAMCEGRVDGGGANGNIDLILKRSTDSGKTWGPEELIMDGGKDTLVNFCPVVDRSTGVIWLVYARNVGSDNEERIVAGEGASGRVFITHSRDSGRTWAKPVEMTDRLTRPGWTWVGGSPAAGIQLKSGRLLVPAYHAVLPNGDAPATYESHMIYSDDHGKTWQLGETVASGTNECVVAERRDGSIYYSARALRLDSSRPFPAQFRGWRKAADSSDGGKTWNNLRTETSLVDDPCQGFLHAMPNTTKPTWIFTQPGGPRRRNLVARVSFDEGRTWPGFRRLVRGDSGYSSAITMPDGRIGCLYEIWDLERRTTVIRFMAFSQDWLFDTSVAGALPKVEVKAIRKIEGSGADHNAFTDLIRFKDKLYLTFRKSDIGHGVYPDSKIMVMSSDDGRDWSLVHSFSVPDRDVRDPHFMIFKDRLFIYSGTWDARPLIKNKFELNDHIGVAVATDDGKTWTDPKMLEGTHGHYIWRAVSVGDHAYLCARRVRNFVRTTSRPQRAHRTESVLLTSDDGWVWKYHATVQPNYGDETAWMLEDDGSLLGVARSGYGPAQAVRSVPPFKKFERFSLDRPIGGPLLARWNGHNLVGGRNTLHGKRVCALYWMVDETLYPILELRSGGDTSYPGFVQLDENRALVSYYSSHENMPRQPGKEPPSSIFVAELQMRR